MVEPPVDSAEAARCTVCGACDAEPWAESGDKKFGGPGRFAYRRCRRCGMVWISPQPSAVQLARYYPDHVTPVPRPGEGSRGQRIRQWLKRAVADEWYGYGERRALGPWHRRLLRRVAGWPFRGLLRQVPRHRAGGHVLDIGCGSGGYLAFLAELGWKCSGVETGAKSRAYAQTVLGLDVREGPLEACGFPDASFDVVTLWHVIEHLPDPVATVREIRRVLKPEGLLLLRTPNVESWEAALFRGDWYGLDAPRHLHLFSPATMERLLQRSGFAVTAMRYNYHAVDCSRSLLYRCRDMSVAWPARIVAGTIGAIELLLGLLLPLRRVCGRGAAVHVEARKAAA